MSRKKTAPLDKATRDEFASRVKSLRLQKGLKQEELADNAKVSRQTLSDIENGRTTPQTAVIVRVLEVLGVDIEPPKFEEQTELWLAMIGALIEAVPEPRRNPAVDRVVRVLAEDIKAGNSGDVSTNYEDEDYEIELGDVGQRDVALAAKRGRKKINEPHAD